MINAENTITITPERFIRINSSKMIASSLITRLEASSNYTCFYLSDNSKIVTSKVMKSYEENLLNIGFVRIHRSHLINIQFIAMITKNSIFMKDGTKTEISRRQKNNFFKNYN